MVLLLKSILLQLRIAIFWNFSESQDSKIKLKTVNQLYFSNMDLWIQLMGGLLIAQKSLLLL